MYRVGNTHNKQFKKGDIVNRHWTVIEVIVIDGHQHVKIGMTL